MSSEVFVLSSASHADPAAAIRHAADSAGVSLSRLQQAAFGFDGPLASEAARSIVQEAGLSCPWAVVTPSMQALFFSAACILADDSELSIMVGIEPANSYAFVLASPEAVGRLNLLPCARLAARSLGGAEHALRLAGLTADDVLITKAGSHGAALLHDLLAQLESQQTQWGLVTADELALLVERT